jgi:hypothetical protein
MKTIFGSGVLAHDMVGCSPSAVKAMLEEVTRFVSERRAAAIASGTLVETTSVSKNGELLIYTSEASGKTGSTGI